jgi:hypothetical protein
MSRLIRWVTGEPVSHCAIECDGWVIHANLLGVHAEALYDFEASCEILHSVEMPANYERLLGLFCRHNQSGYDLGAMLYLGLRLLFPALPKKNLWQCSGMFLCTEWVTEFLSGEPDSLITPYKLYKKMKGATP